MPDIFFPNLAQVLLDLSISLHLQIVNSLYSVHSIILTYNNQSSLCINEEIVYFKFSDYKLHTLLSLGSAGCDDLKMAQAYVFC